MRAVLVSIAAATTLADAGRAQDPFPWDDGQLLPHSEERVVAAEELDGLSVSELRIARNEIFARHGYVFQSEDLLDHFGETRWYVANPDARLDLSPVERANVRVIQLTEESRTGEGERFADDLAQSRQTWRARAVAEMNGSPVAYDPLYGRGVSRFRSGALDSPRYGVFGPLGAWFYDLEASRARLAGDGTMRLAAFQFIHPDFLKDARILQRREADLAGEPVEVWRVESRSAPQPLSLWDARNGPHAEPILMDEAEIEALIAEEAAFAVPGGLAVTPRFDGELWVTRDRLVVRARLRGHALEYDYDHWTVQPFDMRLELQDLERLDLPDSAFEGPPGGVDEIFAPG